MPRHQPDWIGVRRRRFQMPRAARLHQAGEHLVVDAPGSMLGAYAAAPGAGRQRQCGAAAQDGTGANIQDACQDE
jgi:hypothetical protein